MPIKDFEMAMVKGVGSLTIEEAKEVSSAAPRIGIAYDTLSASAKTNFNRQNKELEGVVLYKLLSD